MRTKRPAILVAGSPASCRQDAGGPAGWKPTLLFLFLIAPQVFAQAIATTPRGVLVAHDGVVEMSGGWTAEGVRNPRTIVTSNDRAAILDPLTNEVRIVDLATGRGRTVETAETPIDAVFAGSDLFVITRDGGTIERIDRGSIRIGADPAFIRSANGKLYVYQRLSGTVSEITIGPFAIARQVRVAAFASDFEVDGRRGYLVTPRSAKIATIDLATMKPSGTIDGGAVPVDLAIGGGGTALTARTLAIADPSGKRVWMIEGTQSMTQAVARGFLRGLLGLGLYSNPSSQFPTGVDRVFTSGGRWVAYDSSTGTLYRFSKSKSSVIATGVPPNAYAVTRGEVIYWTRASGLRRQASGPPPSQ